MSDLELMFHVAPTRCAALRRSLGGSAGAARTPGAQVDWSLEEGTLCAGEHAWTLSALTLRLGDGGPAALFTLALDLARRHGLWLDTVPSAQRLAWLRAGRTHAKPVKASLPGRHAHALEAGMPLLRAAAANCLQQILPNAAAIACGSTDPEHVHQLRVGLRRLRCAGHVFAGLGADLPPAWEQAVQPLFDALGAARDRYLLLATLAPRLRRAGAALDTPPDAAPDPLPGIADLVRGFAVQSTLLRLLGFARGVAAVPTPTPTPAPAPASAPGHTPTPARTPASTQGPGPRPWSTPATADAASPAAAPRRARARRTSAVDPLPRLRRRLRRLLRQVTRNAAGYDALPFEAQHRLRKRLKRLRYAAQFLAPLGRPRAAQRWLAVAALAQDALGRHVDLVLAARRFEHAAQVDPRALFALQWLQARARRATRRAQRALRALRRCAAFW